jgi:NAD(P)-dependent dehydrogenase (short-subunit alcohol dehydrogenase family)
MTQVIVVIGAGSIGQAIVRRISAGKHVLLADLHRENADAASKTLIDAGFNVTTTVVDVASRESVHSLVDAATKLGEVFGSERLTGALLDRLTHHVHILEMNGDSYRLKQSRRKRTPPADR